MTVSTPPPSNDHTTQLLGLLTAAVTALVAVLPRIFPAKRDKHSTDEFETLVSLTIDQQDSKERLMSKLRRAKGIIDQLRQQIIEKDQLIDMQSAEIRRLNEERQK